MVEALRKVAGDAVAKRVVYKPDARIQAIVKTWPVALPHGRARWRWASRPTRTVESVIRDYIADENITI